MSQGKVNRRDFLRLCLLSAASAGVAACERVTPTTVLPEPSSTPTLQPGSSHIKLKGGGDAWTWNKVVSGYLDNPADCKSLIVSVNGTEVEAALSKDVASAGSPSFSASVPLEEGDNRVMGICQRSDGQEEKSDMSHFQERLHRIPTAKININLDG